MDMRRSRGPGGACLDNGRAAYGSQSEPGYALAGNGSLQGLPDDVASCKRNVASAYSVQNYAGYAKADFTQSTVNLVTCVLGAGALGYPFCFKECGLVLATFIMFVTLVATRISYQLLLHCAQLSMRKTYEGIAESALGKTGRHVLELCIAAMNLGALVAFLDILADVLSAVAGTIIPPGAEPSRHAYITGVTVLGALPVCLVVRDHALIAALSNASVVFVIIFAAVVFCTAFAPYVAAALGFHTAFAAASGAASAATTTAAAGAAAGGGAAAATTTAVAASGLMPPVLHMWHVQGVLVSLPVMAYGFTAHQYYMGVYTMLKAPSVRKMKLVTDLALLICACVYWTVGVGGYATFGERTAGDIIRNLGGSKSLGLLAAYARALKLCYGMAILGNIPLVIMPFYSILKPLLPADEQIKQSTASLASSCTVAGAKNAAAAAAAGCMGRTSSGASKISVYRSPTGKLKTSSAGRDSENGGGDYEDGVGYQQQQTEPLLQPPAWQEQQQRPQHLDPHLATEQASYVLTGMQHALVVFIVLGLGLASAVWLPNVELIFGLTGSTASVLVAFIIPAICFIRLYEAAPELGGGGRDSSTNSSIAYLCCCCCGVGCWLAGLCSAAMRHNSASSSSSSDSARAAAAASHYQPPHISPNKQQQVLVVPELRAQWLCRRRLAVLLLVFGVISGLLCTDAILSSISEEKAVVQLAQELVAHEAVVAEASRAQQKAKEAAAAVDAVSTAAQQLGAVSSNANNTLGALTAAAEALSTIAAKNGSSSSSSGDGSSHSMWDIKGRLEEHKAKVAEDSVLKNVEAALTAATADITATMESVTAVVIKLDASIAQIKADAVAATTQQQQGQQLAAAPAPAAAAAAVQGPQAPDGTVLPTVPPDAAATAGSSHVLPHGDSYNSSSSSSNATTDSIAAVAPAPASSSSSGRDAYERANEMAKELGKALGSFSHSAGGSSSSLSQATAGKSVEQVRDSAVAALTALNVTADVLQQVRSAVAAARKSPKRDANVKELAVLAMQRALNATAASALAMEITGDALSTAATEETSELLTALTKVAQDLERSQTAASKIKARKTSITVTSEGGSSSSNTETVRAPVAAGVLNAAANSSSSSIGVAQPAEAVGAAQSQQKSGDPGAMAAATGAEVNAHAAAAAEEEALVRQQQQQPGHPSTAEVEAAAAARANAAAHAQAAAAVNQDLQQQQPGHPTAEDAASAAAARANIAAHAEPGATALVTNVPGISTADANHTAGMPAATAATAAAPAAAAPAVDAVSAASGSIAAAAAAVSQADIQHSAAHVQNASDVAANATATAADVGTAKDDAPAAVAQQQGNTSISGQLPQQHAAPGVSSSSSSSSNDGAAAAAGSSITLVTAAALSSIEAEKVKGVIASLANVLSSADATVAANMTAMAAAIQGAVDWTSDSKSAVLRLIEHDLGKTQPEIAERVMGIVQDISIREEEAKLQQQQHASDAIELRQQLEHPAAKEAAAAAAAAAQQLHTLSAPVAAAPMPATAVGADVAASSTAGPVVGLHADGQLTQTLPKSDNQVAPATSAAAANAT